METAVRPRVYCIDIKMVGCNMDAFLLHDASTVAVYRFFPHS